MNAWLALYPKSIEALLILQQENKQWLCNEFGHTHCIQNQALEILPPLIIHSNLRGPQDWLVNARQKASGKKCPRNDLESVVGLARNQDSNVNVPGVKISIDIN
jgi:hypothetical protein